MKKKFKVGDTITWEIKRKSKFKTILFLALFCLAVYWFSIGFKPYPILVPCETVYEMPEPISYIEQQPKGYNEIGLPSDGRRWLTRDEFRGRHLLDSSYAMRKAFKDWRKKHQQQFLSWIKDGAEAEQKVSGIPAELVVAQCLLESQYGTSKLAVLGANLFGIKKKGDNRPSIQISDDSPTDLFNVYRSNWESLRHHSKILNGKYQSRIKGKPTLIKWVNCLCGCDSPPCTTQKSKRFVDNGGQVYATSCYKGEKSYSEKLLRIIKSLDL